MDNINISIEQSILSSIIFNQNLDEITNILEPQDFYSPAHQKVYATMLSLHKEDLPLDEEFIRSRGKVEEGVLINILSTNAITNVVAYAKELKEKSLKRELDKTLKILSAKSGEEGSSESILAEAKKALANFENKQKFDDVLTIVDFNSIEETEPKFYLEEILPIQQKEINIISARGGSGKSYGSAYIMLELAHKHSLKCFGWFSEDAVGVTKKRVNSLSKLHNLPINNITIIGKENRAFQFVSTGTNKKLEINNMFYQMRKQLKNYDVIVLDPLIAFFGGDENNNADARYFMNLLNEWCEQDNKTIILIHHHSKGDGGTARGAGAFIDACRIHYTLDYKYTDKEKQNIDKSCRIAKIEKTNHFSGKREYELYLFDNGIIHKSNIKVNKTTFNNDVIPIVNMPNIFDNID